MLIGQLDQTAIATWAGVFATILLAVAGSIWAAYTGSLRGTRASIRGVKRQLSRQSKVMLDNHTENKVAMAQVRTELTDLKGWTETISSGETPHIAAINVRLDNQDQEITRLRNESAKESDCKTRHQALRLPPPHGEPAP